MKTNILALSVIALALSLTSIGCRDTTPKTTKIPIGTTGSESRSKPWEPGDGNRIGDGNGTESKIGSIDQFMDPAKLPDPFDPDREQNRSAFAADTVYFEYDRHSVRPDEVSKLDAVASQFKAMSADNDLLIEGHCDERGTEEYNRALGERRALALRELLIRSGVDAGRVHTKSLGKDRPAEIAHEEAAWSKNRRGEFVLVMPKKLTTTQNTK